jgi:hypothetical protein
MANHQARHLREELDMARLAIVLCALLVAACSEVRIDDGTTGAGGAQGTSAGTGTSVAELKARYQEACEVRLSKFGCSNADCSDAGADAEEAIWGQYPGCFEVFVKVMECSAYENTVDCGICGDEETLAAWAECGILHSQNEQRSDGRGSGS